MQDLISQSQPVEEPSFRQEFYGLVAISPKDPIYIGRDKSKPGLAGTIVLYDAYSTMGLRDAEFVADIDETVKLEDDVRAVLKTHNNPPNPQFFVKPTYYYSDKIYEACNGQQPLLSQFKMCRITITAQPVILKDKAADQVMQQLAVMNCSDHEKEILRKAGLLNEQNALSSSSAINQAMISRYVLYNSASGKKQPSFVEAQRTLTSSLQCAANFDSIEDVARGILWSTSSVPGQSSDINPRNLRCYQSDISFEPTEVSEQHKQKVLVDRLLAAMGQRAKAL